MKKIYAITVWPEYGQPRVSQEAYSSLAAAQAFVENRSDYVEKLDAFHYEGRSYSYIIHELNLR